MNALASVRARRATGLGLSNISHEAGERDWRSRYPEFCARAKGTNVNDRTLLATDYLNHVNEIIMLMELVPDAPECLEDCRVWQPMSYVEHFEGSSIADRDLAIEAYAFSPPEFRATFDRLTNEMHRVIAGALASLEAAITQGDEERARRVVELAVGALKTMVDQASSTIHGDVQIMDQAAIDGLMDMM
ncbi:hypothetical protein [Dongia deserti]|uniref:hypothetical protein n=1 Tax=Dongia deserti TaxID=2268030 RepID=UPI0013C4BE6F|nr:hypothetical protein [Dongia deserti]